MSVEPGKMTMDNSTEIKLDQPNFQPGDKVSGIVMLDLVRNEKITDVTVSTRGFSQVDAKIHFQKNEEKYFKFMIALLHEDEYPIGRHEFPFEFLLPKGLPHTFTGEYGRVEYIVAASANNGQWKSELPLLVHTKLYLALYEPCQNPVVASEKKKLSGPWLKNGGMVSVQAWTDRYGYLPGQAIIFNARIYNDSGIAMTGSRVQLEQTTTFITAVGDRKMHRIIVHQQADAFNKSYEWTDKDIEIPVSDMPPSTLPYCKIIDIAYFVKFIVDLGKWYKPLKLTMDIFIGTDVGEMASNMPSNSIETMQHPDATAGLDQIDDPEE